jgi:phospholipase/carboxylesterase
MNLLHTAHVPRGDGPFPTLFALHGWGASAHDLLGLAPALLGGDALVICPQGPVAIPLGPGYAGYGWFALRSARPPDPEEFRQGAEALRGFVARASETYPVDPQRVVVLGFSQGGMMGYDLALREPGRFRGLAALSSRFPRQLAEDLPKLAAQEEFPVLITHGTEDTMIPVDDARESRELLRPFGVALTYREFAIGHSIDQAVVGLLNDWLARRALGAG